MKVEAIESFPINHVVQKISLIFIVSICNYHESVIESQVYILKGKWEYLYLRSLALLSWVHSIRRVLSISTKSLEVCQEKREHIFIILALSLFFGGFGGGVVFPTIPLMGPTLGVSTFSLSLILSGNRLSRLLSNGIVGEYVDRIGGRRPLILGLLIKGTGAFGYILALYSPYNPGLIFFLSRVLYGIGSGLGFIASYAILFHLTDKKNRGSKTAYVRAAQSFGFPAGLAMGGLISSLFGYETAFLLSSIAAYASAIVSYFKIPVIKTVRERNHIGPVEAIQEAIRDTRILRIAMVNLIEWFAIKGVFLATVALYIQHYHLSPINIGPEGISGLFLAFMMVSGGLVTVVVAKTIDHAKTRSTYTLIGVFLATGGYLIWALFPSIGFTLIGLLLLGSSTGIISSPLLTLLGDMAKKDLQGRTLGIYYVFGDIGSTLGPIFGINMVALIGFRNMYLVISLLMLSTLFFLISLYQQEKRSKVRVA